MPDLSFAEFDSAARTHGFDQVPERHWAPDTAIDSHTHHFAVQALVVEGEMWFSVDGATRHLRPGDRFELDRCAPHAERYDAAGAAHWVVRRS